MPTRLSQLLPTLSLVLAATLAVNADPTPAPRPADDDANPLHECMEGIKDNLKILARSVSEESRTAAVLQALENMQALSLKAKSLQPSNLEDVPEQRRAAHAAAYRADMARLLTELLAMEIDVLENRRDEAAERIRESLLALRERSHEKYQKQ